MVRGKIWRLETRLSYKDKAAIVEAADNALILTIFLQLAIVTDAGRYLVHRDKNLRSL